MDLGLAGATAVVTGGSKGMGLAIAQTLAADGARVAVMARGQEAHEDHGEGPRILGAESDGRDRSLEWRWGPRTQWASALT